MYPSTHAGDPGALDVITWVASAEDLPDAPSTEQPAARRLGGTTPEKASVDANG